MYQGAKWNFSSAEHLEMFNADTANFVPTYDSWCSAGGSKGKRVPTLRDLWATLGGQLFLADADTVNRKGEGGWKTILATPAGDLYWPFQHMT